MADVKKTRTALDNELRESSVQNIMGMLSNSGEQTMMVAGNVFSYPTVDSEGNEAWIEVTVKVPKGERLGKGEGFGGYDGYEQASFYASESARKTAEAEAKKVAAEAKKNKKSKGKSESAIAESAPVGEGE